MLALQRYSTKPGTLKIIQKSKPAIKKNYCILKVISAGICGRDLEHHNSKLPKNKIPFIPGHEFSGIIHQISDNNKFKIGDRVVSETVYSTCEKCKVCKDGNYNLCTKRKNIGGSVDGAFSQYVRVPIKYLHKIPNSITFNEAALIEPASVTYNAVFNNSNLKKNNKVLVIGSGTIGLLTIQMLKLKKVNTSLLCLRNEHSRIKIAKKIKVNNIYYFENLIKSNKILMNTFDYVYDTVGGHDVSINSAIDFVKPNGFIIKLGWFMNYKKVNFDKIIRKSINLKGSFSHNYNIWEKCINLIKLNKINVSILIGKTSPINKWKICFDELINKKYVKVLLKPNE